MSGDAGEPELADEGRLDPDLQAVLASPRCWASTLRFRPAGAGHWTVEIVVPGFEWRWWVVAEWEAECEECQGTKCGGCGFSGTRTVRQWRCGVCGDVTFDRDPCSCEQDEAEQLAEWEDEEDDFLDYRLDDEEDDF